MMTFADPSVLVGLLALAVPLAIHLLGRRRARRVLLPTARFAQEAHHAWRRWLWVKRAALLSLRLAVVALLVLALARPQLGGAARTGGPWLICFDTSPSMHALETGGTRYEQAQQIILNLLSRLPSEAPVTLVRCGEKVRRGTCEEVRAAVQEKSKKGDTITRFAILVGTDAFGAGSGLHSAKWVGCPPFSSEPVGSLIARATASLPRETLSTARLLLVTDATPWALRDLRPGRFKTLPAKVFVVPVARAVQNVALGLPQIRLVETAEQGRRLSVRVNLVSSTQWSDADVHLEVAGQPGRHTRRVSGRRSLSRRDPFQQGSERTPSAPEARFLVPLEGPGPWQGRIWTGPDPMEADNERFFTATAPVTTRVLVVDAAAPSEELVPSAAFVAATFAGEDRTAPKTASRRRWDQVDEETLRSTDVVFWVGPKAGPGRLGAAAPDVLDPFLRRGGGLVWVPTGPRPPEDNLAALLGARFGQVDDAVGGVTINPGGYTSDLLAAFEGGTGGDLRSPVFKRRLVLKPSKGSEVIRFMDGRAAIVSQAVGKGRSVALAVGPSRFWGDLATRQEFVVLAHSLAEALGPARASREANLIIGKDESWQTRVSGRGPGNYRPVIGGKKGDTITHFAIGSPPDKSGSGHSAKWVGRPPFSGAFSVNLALEETADLTPHLDPLKEALPAKGVRILEDAQPPLPEGVTPDTAADLGGWLVLLLALAVGCEGLLADRQSGGGAGLSPGSSNPKATSAL